MILYSTDHCALCEETLDLLLSMPELRGAALTVVDVAENDLLLSQYGARLPVLRYGGSETSAPIDRQSIRALLDAAD